MYCKGRQTHAFCCVYFCSRDTTDDGERLKDILTDVIISPSIRLKLELGEAARGDCSRRRKNLEKDMLSRDLQQHRFSSVKVPAPFSSNWVYGVRIHMRKCALQTLLSFNDVVVIEVYQPIQGCGRERMWRHEQTKVIRGR